MRKLSPCTLVVVVILCLPGFRSFAQLSPPGLGIARTAGWLAVGIRQALDTASQKQSMTYLGLGRKSNPDNSNPYYKPAIFVINQEFYNHFRKHWQYSVALSYRNQDEYFDKAPYEQSAPAYEQEFRIYGRFSYIHTTRALKTVLTFRQEFRKFYTPDFTNWSENFQLRSRLRLQLTYQLNPQATQRLIGSGEVLFSMAQENVPRHWTSFATHESRFTLYYSLAPKGLPFMFDIGYMNDFLFGQHPSAVHYLATDVIWLNPFGRPRARPRAAAPD